MKKILPFLRCFTSAKWYLLLGLVFMVLGLFSSIALLSLSGWFLSATAIAGVVGTAILFNFFYPSASVRGFSIGRTAFRYFEKIINHDATFRILAKLRVQVFQKIIPLSPAGLSKYRNSDLLNRLVADVDTLDGLYIRLLAPFMSGVLVILACTIILSFFSLKLALIIGISLWTLIFIVPWLFYWLGKHSGGEIAQNSANYRSLVVEFIQAQSELVLANAANLWQEKISRTEEAWLQSQGKQAQLAGLSTALVLLANGILLSVILWIAGNSNFAVALAPDNRLYQGAIIALFAFVVMGSFEILMPLGSAFLQIGQITISATRLNEIISQPPTVNFTGQLNFKTPPPNYEEISPSLSLRLMNVDFHYPQQENLVLNQINLSINLREKLAILGKTGSGKSTILQLLVRNYDPIAGEIYLNDQPLRNYCQDALRESFCFLSQKVHIFSDTLRNNLQLSNLSPINDEKMHLVLTQVGLQHLAEQGLDLWLGDGGRTLSGGEQRRLGLARVLLNSAPIILLDEPTEGLDSNTEQAILNLLWEHTLERTLVMVTHRLTGIHNFDRLVVIDDGKIAQQGSFHQLIHQSGIFKNLYQHL